MMGVEEIGVIAVKAVDGLNLGNKALSYIGGVITMALELQAAQYEDLLREANERYRGEGKTAAEFQKAYDEVKAERDRYFRAFNTAITDHSAFVNYLKQLRRDSFVIDVDDIDLAERECMTAVQL